eukprot:scaffold8212_cov93-Cylindrotheca_fusiformis.AAC.8
MTKIAYSLSFLMAIASSVDGFAPPPSAAVGLHHASVSSSTKPTLALHVSVVSQFLTKEEAASKIADTFETETPESVGMAEITESTESSTSTTTTTTNKRRRKAGKRKHNFAASQEFRKEKPDKDFYTLHSSAVSHLQKDMPVSDIMYVYSNCNANESINRRAIKRAQNLHDFHDLETIAAFLIEECDEDWGYGFRGSLLSRLAVAALHMNAIEVAQQAIQTRRSSERSSMQPYESAAIVRGLMRAGQIDKGWIVLEDELRLPMDGTDLTSAESKDVLKYRASALASIATRHLYNGEPYVAAQALDSLGSLGRWIAESNMNIDELNLPWTRLINAASDFKQDALITCQHVDSTIKLPTDITELVFDAMANFPCPSGEEECGIEEFVVVEQQQQQD